MDEGVRITAGLRELNYENLSLGLTVEVLFEPLKNGGQLPFFKPKNAPGVSNRGKTRTA